MFRRNLLTELQNISLVNSVFANLTKSKIWFTVGIAFIFLLCAFNASYSQQKWSPPANISVLNSSGDDFAPSWNSRENLLYFNSNRDGYSYFYTSAMNDSGFFSAPVSIKSELNIIRNNQSYICFNGDEAYFSSFLKFPKRSYLNIFGSQYKNKVWTQPYIVDSLGGKYFCSHPTVSPDGKTMIFSTDRDSQNGDADLWVANRQNNGTWGNLLSLQELNSPGNEITPFLAANDTLYFASDGFDGAGGYDLYMSVNREGRWSRPVPMSDFNTQWDESDLIITPSGVAVFASTRPEGKGKLDLYSSKKVSENSRKEIPQELEIWIGTQVESIAIKKISYVHDLPVPDFLFIIDTNNSHDFHSNRNNFSESDIAFSFDSVVKYLPAIVGHRMLENPDSKLFLSIPEGMSPKETNLYEAQAQLFRTYFAAGWGIGDDRLVMSKASVPTGFSLHDRIKLINLRSDNDKIFQDISTLSDSLTTDPPQLDVYAEFRPRKSVSGFKVRLVIGNKTVDSLVSIDTLISKKSFNLEFYKKLLFSSDSITMLLDATDKNGIVKSIRHTVYCLKSETKGFATVKINNHNYRQYYIFTIKNDEKLIAESIDKIKNDIDESNGQLNKVKIEYFDNTDELRRSADRIMGLIKSDKKIKSVENSFIKYNESLSFSPIYSPFMIRILVEI